MEIEQLLFDMGCLKDTDNYEYNLDNYGIKWKIEKNVTGEMMYFHASKAIKAVIDEARIRKIIDQLNKTQIRCIYDFDAETNSITMRETIIVVVRSMSKTKIQQIISGLGSELLAVCYMVEMAGEDE